MNSIVDAKYNNYTLTQDDVNEAASVNLGAGHIILWVKAESLIGNPISATISKSGYRDATITISFQDIG